MTTENTAINPEEPDWDFLNEHVFGDEDPEEAAAAEAARQYTRWKAAKDLAYLMETQGADRASIAKALHESYPDINVLGFSYRPATEAPAAPVSTAVAVPQTPVPAVPAEDTEDAAMEPLSNGLKWVVGLVVVAVLALAAIGFVVSFDTQTKAVEPFFGSYAPLVPLGIDVGIVVFAALNLVLARLNMSLLWLRAVPWVLTAMTLYINLSAHHELVARVAHVALPGMWIVASEVGTHILRIRSGLEAGTRTESLGLVRWILDPVSTFRLWRYMRLWGLTTAKAARESEAQRLESKAALHARYGRMWRCTTPIQLRTAYRLRRLDAETVYAWRAPVIVGDVPAEAIEDNHEGANEDMRNAREDVPEDTTVSALKDANANAVKDVPGNVLTNATQDVPRNAVQDTGASVPDAAAKDAKARRPRARKDAGKRRPAATKNVSDEALLERLREFQAAEGRPSVRKVVALLGVGKDRAQRLLHQLDATPQSAT